MDLNASLPETLVDTSSAPDAWSDFWSHTQHGAIDLQADDPVAEALREHWLEQVPWMAGCGSIADIGSGPAVVPLLLLARRGPLLGRVQWRCVDQARLPPVAALPATVRILDETDFAVALPLGDAKVGALISNFGLEYLDAAAMAAACARWSMPGARLHAVVHAAGSVIDQVSAAAETDIAWALDDARLLDAGSAVLDAAATLPADPLDRLMHGVAERDAYNAVVNRAKARMDAAGRPSAALMDMLRGLSGLIGLALQGHAGQAKASLARKRQALRGELCRLQAMRASALDHAAVAALTTELGREGFTMEAPRRLQSSVGDVGWIVVGRRV